VIDGTFVVPDDLDRQPTARLLAVVVAPDRSSSSILLELRGRVDPLFLPRRVIRVAALPRNTWANCRAKRYCSWWHRTCVPPPASPDAEGRFILHRGGPPMPAGSF
jgi:hypothetical protein